MSILASKNHEQQEYYIYIDGPRNQSDIALIEEVYDLVKSNLGHLNIKVKRREKNIGLANSVISGVSEVLNTVPNVIVLEDDLVLHYNFFDYILKALDFYEEHKNIISISGYQPMTFEMEIGSSTYLAPRVHSWGWATWKDRWNNIDWNLDSIMEFCLDEKWVRRFESGGPDLLPMLLDQLNKHINSWAIRFNYHATMHNLYTVYPSKTFVLNKGFDGTGIHCGTNSLIQNRVFVSDCENLSEWKFDTKTHSKIVELFYNSFKN